MKKKFVLTLALVLMVAVTLTAARPLEVSGSFESGYDVVFDGNGVAGSIKNDHKTTISADFTGDFWKVSLTADPAAIYGKDKAVNANAELYLDKALKEEGVDLGDFALTLHVGSGVGKGVYTVLADKAGFRNVKLAAYGNTKKVEGVFANNFGVTLGYAKLVKVYASLDPTSAGAPMVVAAQSDPVDGVTVALGFTNAWSGVKALTVSGKADVKKLADLDFDLAVTAEYIRDIDNGLNLITADVAGAWEGIEGYVAYQMTMAKAHQVAARAGYSTEIDKATVGGGVKFVSTDLENKDWNVVVDASAEYAFGGATYSLGAEYDVQAKAFTLSPRVAIKF